MERLEAKGHTVLQSPNTKLTQDQYDVLMKEFASERIMKMKAHELSERRREDVQTRTSGKPSAGHPQPSEEEAEPEDLSAEDLRNKISAKPMLRRKPTPAETSREPSLPQLPVIPRPDARPRVEPAPEPPVSEQPVPPAPEADPAKKPGLTILGKIDPNQLVRGRNVKPSEPPRTEQRRPEPPRPEQRRPEPPRPEQRRPEPPRPEQRRPEPPRTEPRRPEPPVQRPVTPPPPAVEPIVAKTVLPDPQPKPETAPQPPAEIPQEEKVIRADDRTPTLRGLTVMGKIELPDEKKKQAAKGRPPGPENRGGAPVQKPATPQDAGAESEEAKKKRRRRKRKRKEGEGTPASPASAAAKPPVAGKPRTGTPAGKAKKENPDTREVSNAIRNTFSQMGKGASRQRQRMRRAKRDDAAARRELLEQQMEEQSHILEVTEFITANEFANLIEVPVNEIITKCFQLGMMVSINQRLDHELLSIIAEEYGYEIQLIDLAEAELEDPEDEDTPESLRERSPIITVMGHVDHGKTTLLDHLRKSNVTAQEAGGITQHIGAYEVKLSSGRSVTFLDTPGHEAFTAMRARGAKITDIVIIVIAADDAVMPQTREAINHAQAAGVPMVFAINKIDKPGADSNRIKTQLSEMNLLVEEWGGKYQSQEISALKGLGVDDLLEKVILEADLLELKANPVRPASGTVLEARVDKGRGNVATILVQTGTLRVGDEMVAGIHYGKVRALINQKGERIKEAGPSMPVQVLGLGGLPLAGDKFYVFGEEGKAREIATRRSELFREQQLRRTSRLTLEEIGRRRALGNFKELNIIIRGDVDGSVEALSGSLLKLSTPEVQVNIILKAVGAINEADVNLALASDSIILAFNVRPNAQARALAEREKVDIRTYSVIYDAINDVRDALEGLLSPEIKEEMLGMAEVKEIFSITRVGNVAGALVTTGRIFRNEPIRVIRDGVVIFEGKLGSLKRFKDDVKDVVNGMECGFTIDNFNDLQVGDIVESYRINEIRRKL
ncbi:MAG: translation initiation factor IF-2 [Bacteroidia bacterium]|nr:translation initiation factor IF-2 [Bacteroidia bacterium]